MAKKKQPSRALYIFYALVIYVVLQFLWWSVLLLKQRNNLFMVIGEGAVFLFIMFLGVMFVKRAFHKEQELLKRQNIFLHSVTHEFKSPIASLRLQTETLLKRNLTNEQQQLALNNSLEDTERLDRLLEKILTAARIDNGELPIVPEYLNLSEKTNELLEQIKRKNPHRIIAHIETDINMNMDAWALESIITNLIENALLYSPAEKPVIFEMNMENKKLHLTIKDEGNGIPDYDKQKIFQKFYRAETASGYKGTGLGLFLVNYFVNKLNGKIQVKDNKPQGSVFEIIFQVKN